MAAPARCCSYVSIAQHFDLAPAYGQHDHHHLSGLLGEQTPEDRTETLQYFLCLCPMYIPLLLPGHPISCGLSYQPAQLIPWTLLVEQSAAATKTSAIPLSGYRKRSYRTESMWHELMG